MSDRKSLFDLGDDMIALDAILDECDGEVSPEADLAIQAWFAELQQGQARKLDNYAAILNQWAMEEVAAKAERDQWAKKATVRANRQKWMKERMLNYLELTRQPKVITEKGLTVALQNNGGILPMKINEMATVDTVPPSYVRVIRELDNDKIREDLESGKKLDFAHLEPRGKHVRIRK